MSTYHSLSVMAGRAAAFIWASIGFLQSSLPAAGEPAASCWQAPSGLAVSPDGRQLYVACAKGQRALVLDSTSLEVVNSISLSGRPSGIVCSADGRRLYVTCAAAKSQLAVIDIAKGKVIRSIPAGHTACGPVLTADGNTAFVCNRFDDCIGVVDLVSGKEKGRIPVEREPVAAALTPDGRLLLVANHLHAGRADTEVTAAHVNVVDTAAGRVTRTLSLPNGSGLLNDIRISPDGRYACVTHILARYQLPTSQVERGWINSNGLTIIDLTSITVLNTVLLDNTERGAAYPWGCGWSADGTVLYVTHAGTHEVSRIDFPALLAKLKALPETLESQLAADYSIGSRIRSDVPNDLAFLTGLRDRIQLQCLGPRAAALHGDRLYVAGYFSDTVEVVDLGCRPSASLRQTTLSPGRKMSVIERGEFLFNDASICQQNWQSCASCHSDDARVDGLNWDLLNDGVGNPKNNKSLLLSHRTPPAMSTGVRDTAEMAVRAGIRHILYTEQPEEVPQAIDEWLKTLKPVSSPFLVSNRLSAQARRGEKIFKRTDTGCASCHPPALYTDLGQYDVGTLAATDRPGERFDTPTLIEIWRTAPYLHDGSAATLREVLVDRNRSDRHGQTSHLKPEEIEDLVAYLKSL